MSDNSLAIEKGAKILQQHDEWLAIHMNKLIEKYPGKIVAIADGEVVKVGDTYQEVIKPFLESEEEWMPLIAKIPHPDDIKDLLI